MAKASREFQVFVKPGGSVCNLQCQYCYYLKKKDLYQKTELFRMSDDVLEAYIIQHIDASDAETINFSWHGGEPTILGLDYFQKIVELERKHQPLGRQIRNSIQTNGTLLDEDWCRFLATEGFGVGLSLDGPKELHDLYRISKKGKPTLSFPFTPPHLHTFTPPHLHTFTPSHLQSLALILCHSDACS